MFYRYNSYDRLHAQSFNYSRDMYAAVTLCSPHTEMRNSLLEKYFNYNALEYYAVWCEFLAIARGDLKAQEMPK